ncbi:MAG TPA: excalibur calcium-binding domain-containing protein [Sphingomicrobium sp.]|nr:excalibur calcium-binding domain-containing protein [Sphingomicrobium sp.]
MRCVIRSACHCKRSEAIQLDDFTFSQPRWSTINQVHAKHLLWGAVLLGTAAGYVWSAAPAGSSASPAIAAVAPVAAPAAAENAPSREDIEHSAYYPNCDAARAAGKAPIFRGQPGYRPALDADGDGIACEPYRGR